jgi:hypothetical protein
MKQKIGLLLLSSCILFTACEKNTLDPTVQQSQVIQKAESSTSTQGTSTVSGDTVGNNVNAYLRVEMAKDSINSDNILIVFKPSSKTTYVAGEDAPSLQGFGHVSLASFSSDNVPLAINSLPLTKQGLKIGLRVNAAADGAYSLDLKNINALPAIYTIWLMDNYKKDSLDFSGNPNYSFNLEHADTASFGGNRFKLVIRPR